MNFEYLVWNEDVINLEYKWLGVTIQCLNGHARPSPVQTGQFKPVSQACKDSTSSQLQVS